MVKPEWGTKRTCPKCATRFYDLTKDEPVTCINCGASWNPEPVLKSKQPLPYEAAKAVVGEEQKLQDADLGDEEDLDLGDEDAVSPDDEVDLGGDDDLGVDTSDDDNEH